MLIHSDTSKRQEEAEKILSRNGFSKNHPDLLWIGEDEKLGVEQARQIREFLTLKPYQGASHAVVLLSADNLTSDAQNALLKTLEEPLGEVFFILGLSSADHLLPTVLSRCQIIDLTESYTSVILTEKQQEEVDKLLKSTIEQRFQYIEKLKDRESLLMTLIVYFRQHLLTSDIQPPRFDMQLTFIQDLIQAERWAKQNVNIRAILEYLMLKIPN